MLAILAVLALVCACATATKDVEASQRRVELAKSLLREGQDAAAETELKKAIALDPRNEEAFNVMGLVHMTRAERNVRLVEIDDCPSGDMAEGLRAEASDQMRAAEAMFERATRLAPDFGEAWQNRAVAAMYFEDWDRAVGFEEKALEHLARLDSEALARANLGWALYHKKDYARASAQLLQATQREPRFCLGNYRLAEVLLEREHYPEAVRRVLQVIGPDAECPPIQQAYYVAGQVYLRVHDADSASFALARCVELAARSCMAQRCQKALASIAPGPAPAAESDQ